MHWTDQPIHVIDFEGNRAYGIVEYGVATLHNGHISSCHTRLCRPTGVVPEVEARVHGIRNDTADHLEPFANDRELFFSLRASGPFCAHNAVVESSLIRREWPYPNTVPDFMNPGAERADWGPWIDTLRLYELVFPMFQEHGLKSLIQTFQLQDALDEAAAIHCPPNRRRYHCALYDAIAAAMLLFYLGRLPGFEEMESEWLMMMSQPAASQPGQGELF